MEVRSKLMEHCDIACIQKAYVIDRICNQIFRIHDVSLSLL